MRPAGELRLSQYGQYQQAVARVLARELLRLADEHGERALLLVWEVGAVAIVQQREPLLDKLRLLGVEMLT